MTAVVTRIFKKSSREAKIFPPVTDEGKVLRSPDLDNRNSNRHPGVPLIANPKTLSP